MVLEHMPDDKAVIICKWRNKMLDHMPDNKPVIYQVPNLPKAFNMVRCMTTRQEACYFLEYAQCGAWSLVTL